MNCFRMRQLFAPALYHPAAKIWKPRPSDVVQDEVVLALNLLCSSKRDRFADARARLNVRKNASEEAMRRQLTKKLPNTDAGTARGDERLYVNACQNAEPNPTA
jgi:hypothetical protein